MREAWDLPLLTLHFCTAWMVPPQHRRAHASIAIVVRMCVDFRSDHNVVHREKVFRCSIAIPTAMLFTLRRACYHARRKTRFRCCGSQLTGWAFTAHYVKRPFRAHYLSPPCSLFGCNLFCCFPQHVSVRIITPPKALYCLLLPAWLAFRDVCLLTEQVET